MRPLTIEEKAQSRAARKQANKDLAAARKNIDRQYVAAVKAKASEAKKEQLRLQMKAIREVKGLPVIVQRPEGVITLNYELLHGMLRRLKGRWVKLRLDNGMLHITHTERSNGNHGEVQLYEMPRYQRLLLMDLPIIQLD